MKKCRPYGPLHNLQIFFYHSVAPLGLSTKEMLVIIIIPGLMEKVKVNKALRAGLLLEISRRYQRSPMGAIFLITVNTAGMKYIFVDH